MKLPSRILSFSPLRANKGRGRAWFFIRLLGSLALLVVLLIGFDWPATMQALSKVSWWGIGALLVGLSLNRLLAFYRFWVLLRMEGVQISLGTVVRVSFLATFASNFLPTTVGGDLAKIGWLASQGYPAWRMALWTLFDRLSNMLAVGLLLPFCLLLPFVNTWAGRWLGEWRPDLPTALFIFFALSLGIGAALGFAPDQVGRGILRFAQDDSLGGSFQEAGLFQKAKAIWTRILSRRRSFGLLTLISMASILPNLIGTWLVALDLGMSVSFWGVAAIYAILYFVTLLPVSINGLGLQEVSTVALYMSLGGSEPPSVALAILLRFAIWITTLPGAFWLSRGLAVPIQPTSESDT